MFTAYDRLARRTWEDNVLFSVLVELTYRCNLDCFFCYNDVGLKGVALRAEDYLRLFEDLRDMQVMNPILSGGEPLAHPDFMRIGRAGRDLGFLVRIKSNGHALAGKLARRLKEEVDPYEIEVSLHGACAATHDRQTRVPGSFDRLVANLGELRALGLRVKINSTLTCWNEGEIEAMFALADRLGLVLRVDPVVTPRDDGDTSVQAVAPTAEGMKRLFRLQAERARASEARREPAAPAAAAAGNAIDADLPMPAARKHCGAGSATVAVDPFGNVYPCVQWRQPIGNLRQSSIKQMWASSPALDGIRATAVKVKEMVDGQGSAGSFMGFCPGLAWSTSGDPLAVYPEAESKMRLQLEVERERAAAPRPEPALHLEAASDVT